MCEAIEHQKWFTNGKPEVSETSRATYHNKKMKKCFTALYKLTIIEVVTSLTPLPAHHTILFYRLNSAFTRTFNCELWLVQGYWNNNAYVIFAHKTFCNLTRGDDVTDYFCGCLTDGYYRLFTFQLSEDK